MHLHRGSQTSFAGLSLCSPVQGPSLSFERCMKRKTHANHNLSSLTFWCTSHLRLEKSNALLKGSSFQPLSRLLQYGWITVALRRDHSSIKEAPISQPPARRMTWTSAGVSREGTFPGPGSGQHLSSQAAQAALPAQGTGTGRPTDPPESL